MKIILDVIGTSQLLAQDHLSMEFFNSTSLPPMASSYSHLVKLAHQNPNLSSLENLWEAYYSYWNNDVLATGKLS
jgi:methylsterol monooxygenase